MCGRLLAKKTRPLDGVNPRPGNTLFFLAMLSLVFSLSLAVLAGFFHQSPLNDVQVPFKTSLTTSIGVPETSLATSTLPDDLAGLFLGGAFECNVTWDSSNTGFRVLVKGALARLEELTAGSVVVLRNTSSFTFSEGGWVEAPLEGNATTEVYNLLSSPNRSYACGLAEFNESVFNVGD